MGRRPSRKRAPDAQWVDEVAVDRVVSGGLETVGRALTYAEIMAVYDLMSVRTGAGVKTVVERLHSHSIDPDVTEDLMGGWVRRREHERRRTECLKKTFSPSSSAADTSARAVA